MVGPGRPQMVLFGSSIVQYSYMSGGWGAMLTTIYSRKADIFLRGYLGWNSRRAVKVLDQIFPKDAAVQPSLVIVYFGGNDAVLPHPTGQGSHVPLPEYVENMKTIILHLQSLSETTRLIFLSTPPVNEDQIRELLGDEVGRTNENCRIYSEALLKLCQEMDVKAIDLWTAIQKREDWLTTSFTDGIHLSEDGSMAVLWEILGVLTEAKWEPTLHWGSMQNEFDDDQFDSVVDAEIIAKLPLPSGSISI